MTGIHRNTGSLFIIIGIIPKLILLQLVAENAENKILDREESPVTLPFFDYVVHSLFAQHLNPCQRPEYFIGSIIGKKLCLRYIHVRWYNHGRTALLHFRHQSRNLLIIRPLQSHRVESRRVIRF